MLEQALIQLLLNELLNGNIGPQYRLKLNTVV